MKKNLQKGFTLVELLIVIAILGTLAVVVLIAINPLQQLARTRDAGRKSSVTQLGHNLEAYGVGNNGIYLPEGATWITSLVTAGEIQATPGQISNSLTAYCTTNAQNGFCYDATTAGGGAPAIVFSRLEATTDISRCGATFAGTDRAYAAYSTGLGRGGIICTTGGEPTVGAHADGSNWLP